MPIPDYALEVLRDPPSEQTLIRIIKEFLVTPSQNRALNDLGLSIWDVLNGHYPANSQKVADILRAWNESVGEDIFFILS